MLTVGQLYDKIGAKVAPGNPKEFLRLLNEADGRLTEKGKWRWCRTVIELTPAAGIITLPQAYNAILAARVDGKVKEVHSLDYEFLAYGPGELTVDGAKSYHLHDQGPVLTVSEAEETLFRVHGDLSDETAKQLYREGPPNIAGHRAYYGLADPNWSIEIDGDMWSISQFNLAVWISTRTALVDPADNAVVCDPSDEQNQPFEPIDPATGVPVIAREVTPAVVELRRTYKIEGGEDLADPLSCLVSKAPVVLASESDYPNCPSVAPLKLAMLAIVYEESNNLERARAFWEQALIELDQKNEALQGGAKVMHEDSSRKAPSSRPRTNFM